MDQVLFHLLDAALAAPAPPEWLALSAFITSFPPVADACRLARACLAAAQKYQHPADERCATFPCPLCQDRIDASRKALELCHSALLNTAETTTLPEAEIDARSQLTRACRVELVGAVAQAQWRVSASANLRFPPRYAVVWTPARCGRTSPRSNPSWRACLPAPPVSAGCG